MKNREVLNKVTAIRTNLTAIKEGKIELSDVTDLKKKGEEQDQLRDRFDKLMREVQQVSNDFYDIVSKAEDLGEEVVEVENRIMDLHDEVLNDAADIEKRAADIGLETPEVVENALDSSHMAENNLRNYTGAYYSFYDDIEKVK